jgi:hypothetical protein
MPMPAQAQATLAGTATSRGGRCDQPDHRASRPPVDRAPHAGRRSGPPARARRALRAHRVVRLSAAQSARVSTAAAGVSAVGRRWRPALRRARGGRQRASTRPRPAPGGDARRLVAVAARRRRARVVLRGRARQRGAGRRRGSRRHRHRPRRPHRAARRGAARAWRARRLARELRARAQPPDRRRGAPSCGATRRAWTPT